jgi:hypothetical protein
VISSWLFADTLAADGSALKKFWASDMGVLSLRRGRARASDGTQGCQRTIRLENAMVETVLDRSLLAPAIGPTLRMVADA